MRLCRRKRAEELEAVTSNPIPVSVLELKRIAPRTVAYFCRA